MGPSRYNTASIRAFDTKEVSQIDDLCLVLMRICRSGGEKSWNEIS